MDMNRKLPEHRNRYLYVVLVAILPLLILLPRLLDPLYYDNNVYQSMGWLLSHFGRLPSIGSWDQNFPNITYLHAATIEIFGTSTVAFRSVEIMANVLIALLLASIVRRCWGRLPGVFSALCYASLYMLAGHPMGGQRDVFASLFILLGTTIYLRISEFRTSDNPFMKSIWFILIGILFGIAIGFRPTSALFVVALGVNIWLGRSHGTIWDLLLFCAGSTAGAALSI